MCDGASPLRPSPPQELRSRWTPSFFNASLFSFSRGELYSLPPSRFQRATSLSEGGSYARRTRIYCRGRASLWQALCRGKCYLICNILLCKKLVLIGFGDTVTTRATECAACHESNVAGSPSAGRSVTPSDATRHLPPRGRQLKAPL